MKHYKIVVRGRVQGVGFRYNTIQTAKRYNINGSVTNRMDGSVLIEAEGEEGKLELFTQWCRNGPDWAHVDEITISECPVVGYKEFCLK